MFAIQRDDGRFFCYRDSQPMGSWRKMDKCTLLWMHYYPSVLNRKRDVLRRIQTNRRKIRVVRLTKQQLEYFTFIKLRGITGRC